jgi:lipoprotein-anchoring transpeptidase ErfK/SrfK
MLRFAHCTVVVAFLIVLSGALFLVAPSYVQAQEIAVAPSRAVPSLGPVSDDERPVPQAPMAPTSSSDNPADSNHPHPSMVNATVAIPVAVANASIVAPTSADDDSPIAFPTTTENWIDVDLSQQQVIAYEGTTPVRTFIISSGLPRTPTVTGTFRIQTKVAAQNMVGGTPGTSDYYNLKDVPWVQFFYQGYSFHGTYWHSKFGRPASHGCLNMRTEDAKWLYDWTTPVVGDRLRQRSSPENPGTLVVIHK